MYRDRGLKVRTGSMLLLACIIIACFAYTTLDASAAAQPGLLWVARFNDPMDKNDSPCCVASSPDGTEVYVAGATPLGSVLLSYDSATGLRKWTSRLDGTPVASVVAPDGSMVLVTGGANAGNYITAAFDSLSGARLWESIFDAGPASEDIASDLVVSSDGLHVVVTGTSGVDHPSSDIVTISYDALTGQRDWVERFDGSSHQYDSGVALASSPSAGDVFVTGFTQSGSGVETRDFVTLKYDVSGTQVWEAQFDGSASGEDSAAAIAVSPDGSRVFVTGRSQGLTDGLDFATVAYEASSGISIWDAGYDGPGVNSDDVPVAVTAGGDGLGVFVAGDSGGLGTSSDITTLRYDADSGSQVWEARYNGPANFSDFTAGVSLAFGGAFVVVAGSAAAGTPLPSKDYVTIGYRSSDGSGGVSFLYDGPAHEGDVASSLAVSPTSIRVFVTGASRGSHGLDFATVSYAAP